MLACNGRARACLRRKSITLIPNVKSQTKCRSSSVSVERYIGNVKVPGSTPGCGFYIEPGGFFKSFAQAILKLVWSETFAPARGLLVELRFVGRRLGMSSR